MNSKISLILRILAIVLAGAAVGLWFLIKGEIDNANLKLQPLKQLALTSEEPEKYTEKGKPVDLKGALEIVAPVYKEVNYRREKNRNDDDTIAKLTKTIEERDRTIAEQSATIDDKDKELADLTREKGELENKVAEAEAQVSTLEGQVRQSKAEIATLTERIASMKTMDEYNEKLDEIADLESQMQSGERRYARLRNYARSKGVAIDNNEYPSALYAKAGYSQIEVPFENKYVTASVQMIDLARGLLQINVGVLEKSIFKNGQYEVVVNGKTIGQIEIVQCYQTTSLTHILRGSDFKTLKEGDIVKLIPFVQKR
ncbi:MAG: hypothetical protein K6B46_03840 [Opitutales bacterium]|nr:hypothetical protein [Opitutales bacterium]